MSYLNQMFNFSFFIRALCEFFTEVSCAPVVMVVVVVVVSYTVVSTVDMLCVVLVLDTSSFCKVVVLCYLLDLTIYC